MEREGWIWPSGRARWKVEVKVKLRRFFCIQNSNHDLRKRQPTSKVHKNGDSQ
jgi:hypothetical protein